MSDPGKAVFLSYASQDAEAAKRICETLCAAGVEVWFDQSELVGGDAWDQKIRKQIKDCALLIPIISQNTQARTEGYFRLEWRLADQRTHLMGRNKAFLLPVTIDGTTDADADVPDSFTAVQWTRLRQGSGGQAMDEAALAAFCARVKKLLEGGPGTAAGVVRPELVEGADPGRSPASTRPATTDSRPWLVPVIVGSVVIAVAAVWLTRQPASVPVVARPDSGVGSGLPESLSREWVKKARALYEPWDLASGEDFTQAEALLLRALQNDPSDVDALVSQALLSCAMYVIPHDPSPERRREALKRAELAVKLAPQSDEARFAYAFALRLSPETSGEAIRLLRQLVARNPANKLMLRVLGAPLSRQAETRDEGLELLARAAALPGGDPLSEYVRGETLARFTTRYPEAIAAFDRAIALAPNYPDAYKEKIITLLCRQGEIGAAEAALAQVPATLRRDDRLAYVAYQVAMAANDPDRALRALAEVGPVLTLDHFNGPAGYLKGLAHRRASRRTAAETEWRAALAETLAHLATTPANASQLLWQAVLLALLGEAEGAGKAYELHRQFAVALPGAAEDLRLRALVPALLGAPEDTFPQVRQWLVDCSQFEWWQGPVAVLFDPVLDPWRPLPGFGALVAEAKAALAVHSRKQETR